MCKVTCVLTSLALELGLELLHRNLHGGLWLIAVASVVVAVLDHLEIL